MKQSNLIIIIGSITVIFISIYISQISETWYSSSNNKECGICGKYPIHGGNMENQQISINSGINKENIKSIKDLCFYNYSSNGFKGYVTVDNDENGYFIDDTGNIRCIDINKCTLLWKLNMSTVFKNESFINPMPYPNTATLYKNKKGIKGLIFGMITGNESLQYKSCWIVSINIDDQTVIWKTIIINESSIESAGCKLHGVMVDNNYAFGGVSSNLTFMYPSSSYLFRGKAFKIDINTGKMVNEWYSLPSYDTFTDLNKTGYYSGNGIWPIFSVINEYFVFGTGQLFSYPRTIEKCLLNNSNTDDILPIDAVYPYNPCGDDVSNILKWRCFEKNIHTDSLIILNKHTFKLQAAVPFSGVDAWNLYCEISINTTEKEKIANCPKVAGVDADAVAIASYIYKGKPYVAVGQKNGQFYVVEIPSGKVKISKKIGPWYVTGGSSPFSMAVDEKNMIAIYSFRGMEVATYKYELGDGTIVCDAGSIHAIDLKTGYTIWQWVNPYGNIGKNCGINNSEIYDKYIDPTIEGTCERAFDGSDMLSPNKTVNNVIIPPISDLLTPIQHTLRAINIGSVTINNDMIFIPTITGEVFIHDIKNGKYLNKIHCPDYKIIDNKNNKTHIWNREGIRSGVTMYDDKIVFYCGANWPSKVDNPVFNGGQVVVVSL